MDVVPAMGEDGVARPYDLGDQIGMLGGADAAQEEYRMRIERSHQRDDVGGGLGCWPVADGERDRARRVPDRSQQ